MIIFEKIRWKNFLSTGNQFTEVSLIDHATTLVIGTNGAGKSTVLDALTFSLFGKPYRKINKPQLLNSVNEKDCLVEIEFSIGTVKWKVVLHFNFIFKSISFQLHDPDFFFDLTNLIFQDIAH